MSRQPTQPTRGGEGEKEESYPRELGKKYMDSAAEEAGSQTVDYLKENMQPMLDDAQAQIDDTKEQALAAVDEAKQRAQDELDARKQQAQDELDAEKARAQAAIEDARANFFSKIFACCA
ncbi:hypothetical protein DFH09DRAFT_1273734 [Mycena vulgaris]|nr:hypothetical protein DFH09DRAFT_1273734 [Mycena vulgaris]